MQSFEGRSVRSWSKEINGTLPGGRNNYFFLFAKLTTPPWAGASVINPPRLGFGHLGSVPSLLQGAGLLGRE